MDESQNVCVGEVDSRGTYELYMTFALDLEVRNFIYLTLTDVASQATELLNKT